MANEVVKSDSNTLQINLGSVQLDGLDDQQKQSLRMLVAQKQVELATELAKKKIVLDATQAEVTITTGAVDSASGLGGSYDIQLNTQTANGNLRIRAKKGFIFGKD